MLGADEEEDLDASSSDSDNSEMTKKTLDNKTIHLLALPQFIKYFKVAAVDE